jgi:YegS C-terminal NAD kinase beta sandwich-like domain
MAVRKGEGWGEPGTLADDGVVVHSDAEARRIVERARRAGERPPPLCLAGGDLCRTLGGRGDVARLRSPDAMRLPVDLGAVLLDGRLHWFVSHLVARRSWWRGPLLAAMNAEFLGDWDVAPRAHPNDGLLDMVVVAAGMSLADRIRARRRLPAGDHVPHPAIDQSRRPAFQTEFDRPTRVWLDGERVGVATNLSVRIEPDALICVV